MDVIDYKALNDRFDSRYSKLLKAGYTTKTVSEFSGDYVLIQIPGLWTTQRTRGFISNSDILFKPPASFSKDIRDILKEEE